MSHDSNEPGHGHSAAAWTTVTIICLAFTIGTFFFFFENAIMVWASVALAVVGAIVGYVMRQAGYGTKQNS